MLTVNNCVRIPTVSRIMNVLAGNACLFVFLVELLNMAVDEVLIHAGMQFQLMNMLLLHVCKRACGQRLMATRE